jgi:hypothetical protein
MAAGGSGWGEALAYIVEIVFRFLGKFIGRAGEWVFQDVWHAIGTIVATIGCFALLVYLRTRYPKE